jgi:hypothetical protein
MAHEMVEGSVATGALDAVAPPYERPGGSEERGTVPRRQNGAHGAPDQGISDLAVLRAEGSERP